MTQSYLKALIILVTLCNTAIAMDDGWDTLHQLISTKCLLCMEPKGDKQRVVYRETAQGRRYRRSDCEVDPRNGYRYPSHFCGDCHAMHVQDAVRYGDAQMMCRWCEQKWSSTPFGFCDECIQCSACRGNLYTPDGKDPLHSRPIRCTGCSKLAHLDGCFDTEEAQCHRCLGRPCQPPLEAPPAPAHRQEGEEPDATHRQPLPTSQVSFAGLSVAARDAELSSSQMCAGCGTHGQLDPDWCLCPHCLMNLPGAGGQEPGAEQRLLQQVQTPPISAFHHTAKRCPGCMGRFFLNDKVITCPQCKASLHRECADADADKPERGWVCNTCMRRVIRACS